MRFKNNDNTYTQMKITEYTPNILVNYKLIPLSNGKYTSIDRGTNTDRYSSTMTFRGRSDTIRSLVNELTLLRANGKQIEIDEFEENVFGDNIDHSGTINCVVKSFGSETSPVLNVQTISVTFLLTDPTYVGTATLPNLQCLNNRWEGFVNWNTIVNETYTRNNYFVDREADTYVFRGTYNLSDVETRDLMEYWRTTRGQEITINESDWGTTQMFGGFINTPTHDVVISNIKYNRIASFRRSVTITLLRVG